MEKSAGTWESGTSSEQKAECQIQISMWRDVMNAGCARHPPEDCRQVSGQRYSEVPMSTGRVRWEICLVT